LCGPLAEERLTGIAWSAQPQSSGDRAMAEEALARRGDGMSLTAILPQARFVVAGHWLDIQRIADHLIYHRWTTYEQVRELLPSE
jgi:hypothetical protein